MVAIWDRAASIYDPGLKRPDHRQGMSEGAVLELLSRGKKDAYQLQDPVRSWFGTHYDRRSPVTREYRNLYPDNQPRLGQCFDIVLPPDGDILTSFDLRIQMPTWLPLETAAINVRDPSRVSVLSAPYVVQTPTGPVTMPATPTTYGWVNGIANYMIRKWTLFFDTTPIVEGYGEFNGWYPYLNTTTFKAPLLHASSGYHDGSNTKIEQNATLQTVTFSVPLPGLEASGLPLCTFTGQKVYLRFWLRDLSELVESGTLPTPDGVTGPLYELSPAPWMRPIYVDGVPTGLTSPTRLVDRPTIYARTVILNVESDLRAALKSARLEIPFRRQLREYWEIANKDFSISPMKHNLLIGGHFQTLFMGIQSIARKRQNKYSDLLPSGAADWLTNLEFIVNTQDRIYDFPPVATRLLANREIGRDINIALYYLLFGISLDDEPGGACDLTECQKASINMQFAPVTPDPMTGSNETSVQVIGLSWNVLDISNGRATLKFPD